MDCNIQRQEKKEITEKKIFLVLKITMFSWNQ